MIKAVIEVHPQAGMIGLNYIDIASGQLVRQRWELCEAEELGRIYQDLARLNAAEGVLVNYDWAIGTLQYAKRDCLTYRSTPTPVPKESCTGMLDRIMERILGKAER